MTTFGANVSTTVTPPLDVPNTLSTAIASTGLTAIAEVQPSALRLLAPTGSGTFTVHPTISLPALAAPAVWSNDHTNFIDVTDDRVDDLVHIEGDTITVVPGVGLPMFFAGGTKTTHLGTGSWDTPARIAFVDLDGDGHRDFVYLRDTSLAFSRGHGDGTFDTPPTVNPSGYFSRSPGDENGSRVLTTDFNGDGTDDLAAMEPDAVEIMYGQPSPAAGFSAAKRFSFEYRTNWSEYSDDFRFDSEDVDADGASDILTYGPSSHKLWVKLAQKPTTTLQPLRVGGAGHTDDGDSREVDYPVGISAKTCISFPPDATPSAMVTTGTLSANPVVQHCVSSSGTLSLHVANTSKATEPFLHLRHEGVVAAQDGSVEALSALEPPPGRRPHGVLFARRHTVEHHVDPKH